MFKVKDPVSGGTHLVGALLSITGLVLLVYYAALQGTPWHIVSFSIFGASLILLYTASTLYHLLPVSPRGTNILRRLDHMMIYVLIAGTYTPICLVPLRGPWGWSMLGSIWGIALVGIILKGLWKGAPRWLSTTFYLAMGWLVIITIGPLTRSLPEGGLAWLAAGGIFYSIGGVIYALKKPNILPGFGFHEIFHLFVILGSFSHFWLMYRYILYL
ncbi:MAG: hemolysin III family protein [Candidatus Syntrophonatronum acetioxidans]|uniref:Hemolysin III family protein n=1 Tax=Candidatus Syntrophonatronum acetioxidans TaxID=1795816 RepID=A0A424YCX4_9FIRM|nr:MAG: hemolysin III family protein [Candidatus Syntrophonatronum acetioxidans]